MDSALNDYLPLLRKGIWLIANDTYTQNMMLYISAFYFIDKRENWWGHSKHIYEMKNRKYLQLAQELGGMTMELKGNFLNYCQQELNRLQPILPELKPFEDGATGDGAILPQQIISEIGEMIKRGERINFKLLQELTQKIDELQEQSSSAASTKYDEQTKSFKKEMDKLAALLLDVFDMLDLVFAAAKEQGESWADGVEKIINKSLQMLDVHNFEEIKVINELFDGKFMEGIGTVSQQEHQHLAKYSVYAVVQRGFRFKDSGQTVRKAKVITIL